MRKPIAAAVFLALSSLGIGALSLLTGHLESLELKSYDVLMRVARGPLQPPDDIAIVAIDENSIKEFSRDFAWPWPRRVHAALIRQLAASDARAIVFDVVFDLPSNPDDDEALAEAIRASRAPVVLAAAVDTVQDQHVQSQQRLLPLPGLVAAGARVGYATVNTDGDDALRRVPLSVMNAPSLAVAAAEAQGLQTGTTDDPLLIDYAGPGRTIRTVSYYQAIEAGTALPKDVFAGKTVFVGRSLSVQDLSAGAASDDVFITPFGRMAGVEVHANAYHTLATRSAIAHASPAATWTLILILGGLMSAVMLAPARLRVRVIVAAGLIILVPIVAVILFVSAGYWIYTVQPMAIMLSVFGLNTLYQYRAAERERAHVRRALKGYVSAQVLQRVLENPSALELGGVLVDGTVVFADIVGFSTIAESTPPRELTALLNEFFSRLGDAVMHEDGLVDKYIGDAIMAVWGAPLADSRHAARACAAALAMRDAVSGLGGELRARIGIASGTMLAGNLGHRDRMQYTVIGDTVNLASRLEGVNKVYGTGMLAAGSTVELAKGEFVFRRVDRMRVVGKQQPVTIYELLGPASGPGRIARDDPRWAAFDAARDAYDRRDWRDARARFSRYNASHPGDSVAVLYEERCRHFEQTPPAPDWDGVFAATSK